MVSLDGEARNRTEQVRFVAMTAKMLDGLGDEKLRLLFRSFRAKQ